MYLQRELKKLNDHFSFQRKRICNPFETEAKEYCYSGIRHQRRHPTRRNNRGGHRCGQFRGIGQQKT